MPFHSCPPMVYTLYVKESHQIPPHLSHNVHVPQQLNVKSCKSSTLLFIHVNVSPKTNLLSPTHYHKMPRCSSPPLIVKPAHITMHSQNVPHNVHNNWAVCKQFEVKGLSEFCRWSALFIFYCNWKLTTVKTDCLVRLKVFSYFVLQLWIFFLF